METQTNPILNRKIAGKETQYPIKVLQFGEGNFLRAFVDFAFYKLNQEVGFNGGIALVQPLEGGMVDLIMKQDGLYTLFLNGVKGQQNIQDKYLIDTIVEGVNPYTDFQKYLDLAHADTLEFVISNTTEAGIEFLESDTLENVPQKSFPAKLAAFLYERFQYFNGDETKGLTIIPCELINYNAETLKEILLKYSKLWNLGENFENWLENACSFHNTLVDRIVPGYPRNEIEEYNAKIDYQDHILVTAEPFFLWVIEGDEKLKQKLPFHKTNLDVKIVKDMQPYRTRKVRILNGAHTAMVPLSIMYGNETVKQTLDDAFTGDFVSKIIFDEINPTLDMDKEELQQFANEVLDRFRNPYIKHLLSDIALNSISKFKVRVLPSILKYSEINGKLPLNLVFGFACLIRFYEGNWEGRTLPIKDSEDITQTMNYYWKDQDVASAVEKTLANKEFWDENLNEIPNLKQEIVFAINKINANGIKTGYQNFTEKFS